jgi:hypothetical protein
MKKLMKSMALAGMMVGLGMVVNSVQAQAPEQQNPPPQGRGNFNPAEMQQRMMDNLKTAMEVTNDDEWKLIQDRIQKVMDARREVGFSGRGMMGMMRPPGGNRGGGDNAQQGGGRRGMMGQQSPTAQELQDALDAKAPTDQIKAKLAKYRDDRKQKQTKLETAQEELKKVLNVRREAVAVMNGLLN